MRIRISHLTGHVISPNPPLGTTPLSAVGKTTSSATRLAGLAGF